MFFQKEVSIQHVFDLLLNVNASTLVILVMHYRIFRGEKTIRMIDVDSIKDN